MKSILICKFDIHNFDQRFFIAKSEVALLYNLEFGFVYVHLAKTGGTSVRKALESKSGTQSFTSRDKKHMTALDIQRHLGSDAYNSMISFAHVRNPWDLEVSNYHYISQNLDHYLYNISNKLGSFDNYIRWRCRHMSFQQADMVSDESGHLIVDHIHKFENLNESFSQIMLELDIRSDLPKLNSSKHGAYKSYYNSETRYLVEKAFSRDIEIFGYQWD